MGDVRSNLSFPVLVVLLFIIPPHSEISNVMSFLSIINCFELFFCTHFLFWEFLTINLTFVVCSKRESIILFVWFWIWKKGSKIWIKKDIVELQLMQQIYTTHRGRIHNPVGRALDCRAGGVGFDFPNRNNTQGLEITEKWRYCLCSVVRMTM